MANPIFFTNKQNVRLFFFKTWRNEYLKNISTLTCFFCIWKRNPYTWHFRPLGTLEYIYLNIKYVWEWIKNSIDLSINIFFHFLVAFYWTFKTKNPRKLLFEKKVLCKLDYIHLKCNWLANF